MLPTMGPSPLATAPGPGLPAVPEGPNAAAPGPSSGMTQGPTDLRTSGGASAGPAGPALASSGVNGGVGVPDKAAALREMGSAASGAGSDAENDGGAALNRPPQQGQAAGAAAAGGAAAEEREEGAVPLVVVLSVPLGSPKCSNKKEAPVAAAPFAAAKQPPGREDSNNEEGELGASSSSSSSSSSDASSLTLPLSSSSASDETDEGPEKPSAAAVAVVSSPAPPVRPRFLGEAQEQQPAPEEAPALVLMAGLASLPCPTEAAPLERVVGMLAQEPAVLLASLPCPADAPPLEEVMGALAQQQQQQQQPSLASRLASLPCPPSDAAPLEDVVATLAAAVQLEEAAAHVPLAGAMAALPPPLAVAFAPLEEEVGAIAASLPPREGGSSKKRPRPSVGAAAAAGVVEKGKKAAVSSSSCSSSEVCASAAPSTTEESSSSSDDDEGKARPAVPQAVGEVGASSEVDVSDDESSSSSSSSGSEDDDGAPPPGIGTDDAPTRTGVVIEPGRLETKMRVAELRQHFEDLKQTYLLMQSVTRTMRGQQNAVNPPPGGNNTSANPSRGPSPAPSTNPAEQPQQQDGGPVSLSAVFPEMWRPFDSSKTWPMCIFYRNPALDPRVYTACRSEINSVYGDHTSPRQDDPAWNDVMDAGLVNEVQEYLERNKEAFKLGEKVAFSIQALWYDQKTRKAEHKDPKAYSVISALNVQGEADLQLYDPQRRRRHQSILLPEGSLYVMHNEAVTKLDHAVSAPHAAFKDNRVTLVLRFIDKRSLKHLTRQIRRMEKAAAAQAQAKMGGGGGKGAGATGGGSTSSPKNKGKGKGKGKGIKKAPKTAAASAKKGAGASRKKEQPPKPKTEKTPAGPLIATIESRRVVVRVV